MWRRARRELDPPLPPATVHKTDKKDKKRANTIKEWEDEGKIVWRPEPVSVEKLSDELWIGVKCQSNAEIAGSPRNSFRASLRG